MVIDSLGVQGASDQTIGIAYIYNNFKQEGDITEVGHLANLAKQLYYGLPGDLDQGLLDLHERYEKERSRPSKNEIISRLRHVASLYRRVFILIDALDEYPTSRSRKSFIETIISLRQSLRFNLFVTSRPIPDIAVHFKDWPNIEIFAPSHDIEKYVKSHIHEFPNFVLQRIDLQESIVVAIVNAVQGM
jgi:hypothetical protein